MKNRKMRNPNFPDSVRRGKTLTLDSRRYDEATAEGVAALETRTRTKRWVAFKEMTPREFYTDFLKGAEGLDLSPDQRLDLAVFLAEGGVGDMALMELERARGADASVDAAVARWVEAESYAWADWSGDTGLAVLLDEYDALRERGTKMNELDNRRRAIAQKVQALLDSEAFHSTDYYMFHFSGKGLENRTPGRLFPADVRNAVVNSLGVEGFDSAALLPKEEPGGNKNGGRDDNGNGTNGDDDSKSSSTGKSDTKSEDD
ncbi:MAG: hypothetical protein ACYTG4_15180 [Planctomycetota bacterium]